MIYYIVEIHLPTNGPYSWSKRKIFTDEQEAREFLKSLLDEDSEQLQKTEWDDGGPNWEIVEIWDTQDSIVTLEKIDNEGVTK